MIECVVLQSAVLIGVMKLGLEAPGFPICTFLPLLKMPTHKEGECACSRAYVLYDGKAAGWEHLRALSGAGGVAER